MILNVGSGPVPDEKIPGLDITHCDKKDFGPNVEREDMERLSYPNESFEAVYCVNALDHTRNAPAAVWELMRVASRYVYIKCWLDQKQTGYHHYWDFKEDGTFTNGVDTYDLKDWGFKIKYTDTGGERRYSYIEAVSA